MSHAAAVAVEKSEDVVQTKRAWKLPISYTIATLVTIVIALATHGIVKYDISVHSDKFKIPTIETNAQMVNIVLALILVLATAYSYMRVFARKKIGAWVAVVEAAGLVIAFITWYGAGSDFSVLVTTILASAIALSTPLIFGAMSGVVCERVGVVNIAIEGQLLIGAFAGVIVASATNSPWIGLIAAPIAGALLGGLLAFFAVRYNVDQIIIGVVLNVLALGLTTFFFSTILSHHPDLNRADVNLKVLPIPLLSDIPVIGNVFFRHTALTYMMYVIIVVLTIYLFKSRWGLRLRACGEHPRAAATVGINVRRTRVRNVLLGSALAGLGGAYLTIGANIGHGFSDNMSAGNGYIALAAMILGKWHPIGAVGAALMFGFAQSVAITLPTLQIAAPSNIINMVPYIVTIVAVAGFVGRSRPPAAENQPYNG